MLNRAWYWGTTALRGSVRIRTSVSSSRLCRGTTTGRRPTNSGIIPNSIRSRASTCFNSRSFSSISATVSVSPLVLAKSAAAAARRPFPRLEGVPKPKYWWVMKQEVIVRCDIGGGGGQGLGVSRQSDRKVWSYLFILPSANDAIESIESTRCDKQDVCCVHLHRFSPQLPGIFLRNVDDRALQEFQQSLTGRKCWQITWLNIKGQRRKNYLIKGISWMSLVPGEYWPAGRPPHPHLSADGFQGHCRSYRPRPETRYLHVKSNSARLPHTVRSAENRDDLLLPLWCWIDLHIHAKTFLPSFIYFIRLPKESCRHPFDLFWLEITHRKRDLEIWSKTNRDPTLLTFPKTRFKKRWLNHNTPHAARWDKLFWLCCISRVLKVSCLLFCHVLYSTPI